MTERGDDCCGTTLDCVAGEAVFAVGLQPRPGVHRVGFRRQVETNDVAWIQTGDQGSVSRDRMARMWAAENVADLRRHHIDGYLDGAFEDPPILVLAGDGVGVFSVDRGLLKTTDHQHRRAQHDQGPQRLDFRRTQRAHRMEGLDGRKRGGWFGAVVEKN